MKTLAETISWLATDAPRLVLVEVTGVLDSEGGSLPSDILLSNLPYTTKPLDTPSSTSYISIVSGGISFSQSLSLEGDVSIGYGDIELDNTGGEYDYLLTYIWTNRNIDIYIGDLAWDKADMYKIFAGTIADVVARDKSSINIILGDRLQKLNVPISEKTITDSISKNETLIPLIFGECFNVSPINSNIIPNGLEYKASIGPINSILEVRDIGAPVSYTANASSGTFNLTYSPFGQVTCSVQGYVGAGGYSNTVPGILKTIITDNNFGTSASRLTMSEIDLTNFDLFEQNFSYPVGVLLQNRENMLETCNSLAKSINSRLIANSLGIFKLVRLCAPEEAYSLGTAQHHYIDESDIVDDSFSVSEKPPVLAASKIAYCKNWTVQTSGLAGGLPTSHVEIFNSDYKRATASSSVTAANYKLNIEPEEQQTLLINKIGAEAKANTDMSLRASPRYIYSFDCFADKLHLELGDTVTLKHARFGLAAGKLGILVAVSKDWIAGKVTLGVLV